MACQELVELVTAYLDDVLSPGDRARFEAHLAECDDCSAHVAQFEQTLHALGVLPEDEREPASLDALLDVFRGWAQGHGPRAPGAGG
jgi:anti-sigma factor RsiW